MRFDMGEYIFYKNNKCRHVYLVLSGKVKNVETNRIIETGNLIGQDDIVFH